MNEESVYVYSEKIYLFPALEAVVGIIVTTTTTDQQTIIETIMVVAQEATTITEETFILVLTTIVLVLDMAVKIMGTMEEVFSTTITVHLEACLVEEKSLSHLEPEPDLWVVPWQVKTIGNTMCCWLLLIFYI